MDASGSRWWTALRAGAEAGLCATLAMSVAMYGLQRSGLLGRMPPRTIVRRSLAKMGIRGRADGTERVLSTVAHFGFGASQGALYALAREAAEELEQPAQPTDSVASSVPFALVVWAANYAGWLPAARLFPSPTRDRPGRPPSMVLAHAVFGYVLGQVFPRRLRRLRS